MSFFNEATWNGQENIIESEICSVDKWFGVCPALLFLQKPCLAIFSNNMCDSIAWKGTKGDFFWVNIFLNQAEP